MSEKRVKVLLVAEEAAGLQALRAVDQSGHEIVGVLSSKTHGDKRGATVADVAQTLGHEVWPAQAVKTPELADKIRELEVDLLLNVHSLFLIHKNVVAAPKIGSFNLHPGPLPDYAGLNTPSWAVYHGELRYGVTLHWMAPGVDTGEIAYQELFDIGDTDTGLSVSMKCVRLGVPLVNKLLADAAAGTIPRIKQDLSERRLFLRKDVPNGGRLDWSEPAAQVDAQIRASDYYPMPSPWGHPVAAVDGNEVRIAKAARTGRPTTAEPGTVQASDDGVFVAAADEWLEIKRVQVDGAYKAPGEVLREGARLT
ncbi:MAG: formyltransferase family protein [Planctomycetota bacterium]|nr:formyltransferase family protein [Planctomycetota bacterium]